ncbi:MAG: beta-ketoacyl-[acyl-carrier-protein] synthase family protein [Planctomycetales bacterium]|nr:beta-ketoacyl-[acyl-carrier-protein] synthase family protein [Planctomycetales bacterium]
MSVTPDQEPIVLTGIGMIASNGRDRESVWSAVRQGRSNIQWLENLRGIPDRMMIGATVPMGDLQGQLKMIPLCHHATREALTDAALDMQAIDLTRFGCSICAHMGDTGNIPVRDESEYANDIHPWWQQWLPNTACAHVAQHYGLGGPRTSYSTACASSLICIQSAMRMIRDDQADIALAGGADAIDPLFAAGFRRMGVLAKHDDPNLACRPFDANRNGFVMGEGAAVLVIERLSHALRRGARIYAELRGEHALAQAHHVTSLDTESESLVRLIHDTLRKSMMKAEEVGYINTHGTGTEMNDLAEMQGIRTALGDAADHVCVSSTKSAVGHLVNAAGGIELALTALALRDGYAPPTTNLAEPDPACTINCLPGRGLLHGDKLQHAMKVAVAFGGHLVGIALSRWNDPAHARTALQLDAAGREIAAAIRRAA